MRILLIAAMMLAWAVQAAAEPVVVVALLPHGFVEIEGKTFSEVAPLKAKLAEIERRKPSSVLQLSASKTLEYGDAAIDLVLLDKSGLPSSVVAKKVKFH